MRTGSVLAAVVFAAGVATAQTPPPRPPTDLPNMTPTRQPDKPPTLFQTESEAYRKGDGGTPDYAAQASAERMALAEQIATLIDGGRCDEALAAAREARDRNMSRRVKQLCKGK